MRNLFLQRIRMEPRSAEQASIKVYMGANLLGLAMTLDRLKKDSKSHDAQT